MIQHFRIPHHKPFITPILLFLSSIIYISNSQPVVRTVNLNPLIPIKDGARVMTNPYEVSASLEGWNVNTMSQTQWQFVVFLDTTWAFDAFYESTITFSANLNSMGVYGEDILFGFTSTNTEYVSVKIPLDNSGRPNQIFPFCAQSPFTQIPLFPGDIASIPTFDRRCDIAGGSCQYWQNMSPLNPAPRVGATNQLKFTLEHHAHQNTLTVHFEYGYTQPQTCQFGTSFPANRGFKIFIAGADPYQVYSIQSFDIESTTYYPSMSPTSKPSHIPSATPSNNPSATPTNVPNATPTNMPSQPPTNIPSNSPSRIPSGTPSNQPTPSPTGKPSIPPTRNPSVPPTRNPSATPTNVPNATPTNMPSIPPTRNPSGTPTRNPSIPPTRSPIRAPTYTPTRHTISPTTHRPTTHIPTKRPTTHTPTFKPIPVGFQWGAHHQLCPINGFEKKPCNYVTDGLTDQGTGVIRCSMPYDCCMCSTILCGYFNVPCTELRVGQYGMYGVKEVHINGDPNAANVFVECLGRESCAYADITANDVNVVQCNGNRACQNTVIRITEPKQYLSLECTGISACEGLTFEIIFRELPFCMSSDVFHFRKISCATNACHGLNVIVNNAGCDDVIVEELHCIQDNACNNAMFSFSGAVSISKCNCGPSCDSVIGLDKCFEDLLNYKCDSAVSCESQSKTVVNPANGFEWACSDTQSCKHGNFVIEINKPGIDHLNGFKFGGEYSAVGAVFTIINTQKSYVNIGKIECGGLSSCQGTTFITGMNVFIDNVICGTGSCLGCVIKQTVDSPGLPCDTSQI